MGQSRRNPACILAQQISLGICEIARWTIHGFRRCGYGYVRTTSIFGIHAVSDFRHHISEGKTTHPIYKTEKAVPAPDAGPPIPPHTARECQ
jgi:hypothetical protein